MSSISAPALPIIPSCTSPIKILAISLEQGRNRIIASMAPLSVSWLDINADTAEVPLDVAAVVADVPLRVTSFAKRLTHLLKRLPSHMPKLFVIDKGCRIEVVRAGVLGASTVCNRPLHDSDLRAFLAFLQSEKESRAKGNTRVSGLVAESLSTVFDAVTGGGALDYLDVEKACGQIALTLDEEGLEAWLIKVRQHHQGTMQHCLIVAGVMTRFGQKLGMSQADVQSLTRIGLLHDVGKAKIPTTLLDKPGKLTDEEFSVIKTHPYQGFKFLHQHNVLNREELAAVAGHHEFLDGTGYPYGLVGKSIGDLVRITTVCDIYGALVERRSYKSEMLPEAALAILFDMAGAGKIEGAFVSALRSTLD